MIIGSLSLNAILVNLYFFLDTTACSHIGLYLFTFKSKTYAFPFEVTAPKTVEEYGAQLTSPTLAPKSNTNRGSLKLKDQIRRLEILLQFTICCLPKF